MLAGKRQKRANRGGTLRPCEKCTRYKTREGLRLSVQVAESYRSHFAAKVEIPYVCSCRMPQVSVDHTMTTNMTTINCHERVLLWDPNVIQACDWSLPG